MNQSKNSDLSFWSVVAHQLSWRGPVSTLQQRFMKLNNLKGLSVRESILLKKLLAKQKNTKRNWDSILYYFPGRSLASIQKHMKNERCIESDPIDLDCEESVEISNAKVFKIIKTNRTSKSKSQSKIISHNSSEKSEKISNIIKISLPKSSSKPKQRNLLNETVIID
mmetsp:Transcript_14826/g.17155  ORF Transcript_14826/g.17155 Transcript_14826/m.17155 type:complete len:167 (+) Transcript_14826:407-907(+)